MPCVRIATGTWAIGDEMKLIEAVQSALVSAFQIPDGTATYCSTFTMPTAAFSRPVGPSATRASRSLASRRALKTPSARYSRQ